MFTVTSDFDLLSLKKQPYCKQSAANVQQQALYSAHTANFAAHGMKLPQNGSPECSNLKS
jgi:glutamate 5-kinase